MRSRLKRRSADTRRAAALAALAGCLALAAPASLATASKPPAAPKAPSASTGGVLDLSESTAALSGVVNPHGLETSYYFQFGATTAYGAQTPTAGAGGGSAPIKVTAALSGLQLGTTYHYRVVAVSSAGTTAGQDRTFTTKQIPLKFVITGGPKVSTFGKAFSLTGTLSGTGGADHQVALQSNPFPYLGDFTALGKPTTTDSAGNFSVLVPGLSQTTELRVSTTDAVPTFSQVVTVHVAVIVALHVHSTSEQGLVRFSGIVTPAVAGAPVVFQLVRPSGGPVKVGSAAVRRASRTVGRFSAFVRLRRTGSYRALVQVTNGKQVSGYSKTVFARGAPPASVQRRTRSRR